MTDKFPEEQRTFETRLLFIKGIFTDLHPQCEIMAKCIEHKLDRSYEQYFRAINKDIYNLQNADSINLLKNIKF